MSFLFSSLSDVYDFSENAIRFEVSTGRSTKYLMGSMACERVARTGSKCALMCSIVNRATEAKTAMNRRAWIEGPSANNSFMAEVSNQFNKRSVISGIIAAPKGLQLGAEQSAMPATE